MKLMLNDCPTLHISPTLSYTKTALSQVLTKYHFCQEEGIHHVQAADQPGFNAVLIPGYLKMFNFKHPISAIGVGVRIAFPKKFYNCIGLLQLDEYRYNFTEAGIKQTGSTYLVSVLAGTYLGSPKFNPLSMGSPGAFAEVVYGRGGY